MWYVFDLYWRVFFTITPLFGHTRSRQMDRKKLTYTRGLFFYDHRYLGFWLENFNSSRYEHTDQEKYTWDERKRHSKGKLSALVDNLCTKMTFHLLHASRICLQKSHLIRDENNASIFHLYVSYFARRWFWNLKTKLSPSPLASNLSVENRSFVNVEKNAPK